MPSVPGVAPVHVAGRAIGPGEAPYVVAELSGNHNGSLDRAQELIRLAAEAGADAVKLQTYTPDSLTIASSQPWFRVGEGTLWAGRTLHDLYAEAMTPWAWFPALAETAAEAGITWFSTPFDLEALALCEDLGAPAHKVASFELVDHELLAAVAATGKPLVVSTGLATLAEIDEAVRVLRAAGCSELILLHCNSAYPAEPSELHLRTIAHLGEAFGVPAGLSDHTLGITTAVAGVALGACLIEKHLTLRRADGGPDAAFSLEPGELADLVVAVRTVHAALGTGPHYGPTPGEARSLAFRRSLFVVADVAAGEPLTRSNVRSIRPGAGMRPSDLPAVLGRAAACDVVAGTPLSWDLVGGPVATPAAREG